MSMSEVSVVVGWLFLNLLANLLLTALRIGHCKYVRTSPTSTLPPSPSLKSEGRALSLERNEIAI